MYLSRNDAHTSHKIKFRLPAIIVSPVAILLNTVRPRTPFIQQLLTVAQFSRMPTHGPRTLQVVLLRALNNTSFPPGPRFIVNFKVKAFPPRTDFFLYIPLARQGLPIPPLSSRFQPSQFGARYLFSTTFCSCRSACCIPPQIRVSNRGPDRASGVPFPDRRPFSSR